MKNLFAKIAYSVKNMFGKGFESFRKYSHVAVKVTNELKHAVESPYAEIAVNLLPGNIDNLILIQLKKVLPVIALKMAIIHGVLSTNDKNSDAVLKLIEYLKKLSPDARTGFWLRFSGELNMALADGEISLSEAVILAQMAFKEMKG